MPLCSEQVCITSAFLAFHRIVAAVAGAFDLKREAAMALWQLCKDGRHLNSAVEAGALPLFLDLIRLPDVRAGDNPTHRSLRGTNRNEHLTACLDHCGVYRSRWLGWAWALRKWCST